MRSLKAQDNPARRRWRLFVIGMRSRLLRRRHAPLHPNPDARIVLAVRYSLLATGGEEQWHMQHWLSRAEHVAWLFDDKRLSERLRLFGGILLPSLLAQDMPMMLGRRELVVYVSESMPRRHRHALEMVLCGYDWARIVPVAAGATKYPDAGFDGAHAHLRIDDDDALSRDFLSRLSTYVRPEFSGHIVTHPVGYFAGVDDAGGLILRRVDVPMIAMGIAYIAGPETRFRSIYEVGPHFDAYWQAPTIIADKRPAYIRTVHVGQSMYPLTRFHGDPSTTLDEVQRHIEFDPKALHEDWQDNARRAGAGAQVDGGGVVR